MLYVSCAWNCTRVLSRVGFSEGLPVGNVFCPGGHGTLGIVRFGCIVEGTDPTEVDVVIVDVVHVGSLHVTIMTCWCGCVCIYVLFAAGFVFACNCGELSYHPESEV